MSYEMYVRIVIEKSQSSDVNVSVMREKTILIPV